MKKIAENFNRLSRVHQRHRQATDDRQTDGSAIAYSEREREFTSAKTVQGHSHVTHLFRRTGIRRRIAIYPF